MERDWRRYEQGLAPKLDEGGVLVAVVPFVRGGGGGGALHGLF